MGWFWADATAAPAPAVRTAPHGAAMTGTPPPSCPMHVPNKKAETPPSALLSSSCPYIPTDSSSTSSAATSSSSQPWSTRLNPLNMMPTFSQSRTDNQKFALPTERAVSSIPKGKDPNEGNWEYPSPQQMYNAMVRKGHNDAPEDAVVGMVSVHNFLNEGAWEEIVAWERQFGGGMARGWKIAVRGGDVAGVDQELNGGLNAEPPRLLRFQGRPQEPTPKARILQMLGSMYPSRFGGPPPFDRHDWYILRHPPTDPNSTTQQTTEPQEIRYVIDYYDAPPEPTGEPVFYLDVRPAIDRPSALFERSVRWGGEIWWKATGGAVREELKKQQMLKEQQMRENEF